MKKWLQKWASSLLPAREDPAQALVIRNLVRYGIRDPSGFDLTVPARELSMPEARGLALGGILAYWNNNPFYQLPPVCPECVKTNRESIASQWGITTPAEAHGRLRQLIRPGHRQELRLRLKQEPQHWYELFRQNPFLATREVSGIAAWDYARLANLARWCYDLGYLTWDEAWGYIAEANRLAQSEYDSWESFAAGFVAGRLMWNPALANHTEVAAAATFLVGSPLSPWRTLPWESYPPAAPPR